MLKHQTADIGEVAAAIGKEPAWLQRHWLAYHRRTGFPRRIPGTWRWPRKAVEKWLEAGGEEPPAAPAPANQNEVSDHVALAAASLLERYGGNA
ncbi:hypothetical protein [Mesorhizobium sp. Z1-4]|uniref:hypothetical protein n=1 Tax=Mesorhizobium sp. Z1-4 TaxID=2448478 RepID=UPI000FDC77D7|nr:hypothetical protein [Mesorhizobium sp. Z1-4]